MRQISKFIQKIEVSRLAGLSLLAAMIFVRIANPVFVEILRNQSFDLYQRIKPREYTAMPVAIIDIDEASIREYGQWPWPRNRMAQLVNNLKNLGVVATAFDIVFAEEDRLSPTHIASDNDALSIEIQSALNALPSNDEIFAKAIAKSRIVVGQSAVRSARDRVDKGQEMAKVEYAFLGADPKPFMAKFPDIVQNIPPIEKAAMGRGVFSIKPDNDGIFRRIPLVMMLRDKLRLSLSAELLRIATGGKAFAVKTDAAGISGIVLAGRLVKTSSEGNIWPYFSKSLPQRFISAGDILAGKVKAGRLANHLVFVGTSAVGLEDYRATPMAEQMPGVEIHAQAVENILSNQLLIRPNYAVGLELTVIAILGLLAIATVPLLGALWSFLAATTVLTGYIGFSYYTFTQSRLLIDPTFPAASTVLIFILLAAANYLNEEQKRKQIRSAFGQYISPELVDQLADNPDRLVLGGETRELTLLFSDVRQFTMISESYKSDPTGLAELMNSFLTVLSNAIMRHAGTIDKFMGDAVMAFWNAPLQNKDHARAACLAALDMITDVNSLNAKNRATFEEKTNTDTTAHSPSFHEINVGIGINTGSCIHGNMGSEQRFDYTALGDPVNLASRLEGQTKFYGLPIVLGSGTAAQVENSLAIIELDLIRVKGKAEPEKIFALLGTEELKSTVYFEQLSELNATMLCHYRARRWKQAEDARQAVQELDTYHQLGLKEYLLLYQARIAEFQGKPPGKQWDGVYTATSK